MVSCLFSCKLREDSNKRLGEAFGDPAADEVTGDMDKQQAIVVGAGPAGLTAAYELLQRTSILPIVIERNEHLGGLAATISYKGNRMDIGGHRFFSKSDRVMNWWLKILPLQKLDSEDPVQISYQSENREIGGGAGGPDPDTEDRVMLLRNRRSRIFFDQKLFNYPITLDVETLLKLGLLRTFKIGMSYMRSAMLPIRPEKNLEEFLVNRFGWELYRTFFKEYSEKVWGVPCTEIKAEWGAQRVKGLSITKAILHAIQKMIAKTGGIGQKNTETSLIEQFLYPKYGPGQMWQEVSDRIKAQGCELAFGSTVEKIYTSGKRVTAVDIKDFKTGSVKRQEVDYLFSTMPIVELVRALDADIPEPVRRISDGLVYRDFITVGLLINELSIKSKDGQPPLDNWIYIQEPGLKLGRVQIFNNWSPYMVADPSKAWLGLEYFCSVEDELWSWPDDKIISLAVQELEDIGFAKKDAVLDGCVIRVPKAYPCYFGTYDKFDELRAYLDTFENLFLLGRNGMHRYNNQDHSMLSAMEAVDNIVTGVQSKENIWAVNAEQDYHESKN